MLVGAGWLQMQMQMQVQMQMQMAVTSGTAKFVEVLQRTFAAACADTQVQLH